MEAKLKFAKLLFLGVLVVFGTSCSKLIEKTLEDNPEIIYNVIKKNPAKFMTTLREVAQNAEKSMYEEQAKAEDENRKKEFDAPKTFEVAPDRPIRGNASAPITIVEYSDFQCPFCKKGSETIEEVFKNYGDKVRLIYKHLPLEQKHPNARRGAEYFEAIGFQDGAKAFDFKKTVFSQQNETYGSDKEAEKFYQKAAKEAKVDMGRLAKDLKEKSDEIKKRIEADMAEAGKNGIEGTPGYLINGVTLKGAYPYPDFERIINEWLKRKGVTK
jgi:protein-disulfide isomerase